MDALPLDMQIGMRVYDRDSRHIGMVDDFQFAENAVTEDGKSTERQCYTAIMGVIGEAFGAAELSQTRRDRLLLEGYVRIDAAGLLDGDRYVLPEEIASASGLELTLNLGKNQLLRTP
jgi:hypothetical protein